jgi:DNA modification methylase
MSQPWPADAVERRLLAGLRPFERNARTHSADQVAQVARSITEFGWTQPVLIDESGEIIAGHARVLAAQSLGLEAVPTITARGWSREQVRAYVIADNKLALNAGWDEGLLALEMGDLRDAGFDLGLTGFDAAEVDELFARANLKKGLTDADATPEPPAIPFTERDDIWQLGRHRLMCGDCTMRDNVTRALDGVQPHLMVTDPPYGVDYDAGWRLAAGVNKPHQVRAEGKVENDSRADWREAWELFMGEVAYVWHASVSTDRVAESLRAQDFEMRALIIWAKSSLVIGRGHYHHQHEPCWYAVRKGGTGHWQGDRKQSTLWSIPNVHRTQGEIDDKRTSHSTQKPVEAMLRPMLNNSRAGQSVYEPFMGSGTSLIAAEQSGRTCFGLELNPAYVDVAVERWQDFTGERAKRLRDGAAFERRSASDGEKGTEIDADGADGAARKPARSRAANGRA